MLAPVRKEIRVDRMIPMPMKIVDKENITKFIMNKAETFMLIKFKTYNSTKITKYGLLFE